jgi:hypothetical protein
LRYQYLLARAVFFMSIYAVVYGFDSVGIISAIPLVGIMGIYLLASIMMVVAGTIWTRHMRKAIQDKSDEIKKENPLAWLVYGLGDVAMAYVASRIFAFNGFESFSNQMIYLLGIVSVNMLATARVRYVIWTTLG